MRISKARAGHRTGRACHRRWNAYGRWEANALPSHTRGGSRMRESRTYGSVRGAPSNGRPYRVPQPCPARYGRYTGSLAIDSVRARMLRRSLSLGSLENALNICTALGVIRRSVTIGPETGPSELLAELSNNELTGVFRAFAILARRLEPTRLMPFSYFWTC